MRLRQRTGPQRCSYCHDDLDGKVPQAKHCACGGSHLSCAEENGECPACGEKPPEDTCITCKGKGYEMVLDGCRKRPYHCKWCPAGTLWQEKQLVSTLARVPVCRELLCGEIALSYDPAYCQKHLPTPEDARQFISLEQSNNGIRVPPGSDWDHDRQGWWINPIECNRCKVPYTGTPELIHLSVWEYSAGGIWWCGCGTRKAFRAGLRAADREHHGEFWEDLMSLLAKIDSGHLTLFGIVLIIIIASLVS